jgi:hypothetical protein
MRLWVADWCASELRYCGRIAVAVYRLVKNHINLRKYCFMEAIAKVSKVSCCLHMYFLWRHHLPPDKSENDQGSDSD